MRLPAPYIRAIKDSAREAFGPSVIVRLFGSRVHDHLRGGDIDLHVETEALDDEWDSRGKFEAALFRRIEPQKIDVVITERGRTPHAFENIAYRDGIIL